MKIEKRIIKGKHNIKFNDILKTLENGKKVFDMEKIQAGFKSFNMFILASERGSLGKTMGIKTKAFNDFLKNGKSSLFIRNTNIDLQSEISKFLGNSTIKADPRLKDCEICGAIDRNTASCNYKGKPYMNFLSLNGAGKLKGSRITHNNVIWDEINENFKRVNNPLTTAISSIMASTENQVKDFKKVDNTKFWLLCNFKSINHPFVVSLGITDFKDEIAPYYLSVKVNGKWINTPLCVVIRSTYSDTEKHNYINENLKNNWRLALNIATGEADHTYFNESLIDELHNIYNIDPDTYHPYFTLFANGEYLKFSKLISKDIYYVEKVDKDQADEYILSSDYKGGYEGITYEPKIKETLINKLFDNKIYFKNSISRVSLLSSLTII